MLPGLLQVFSLSVSLRLLKMVILTIFASVLVEFMEKKVFRGPYFAIFTDISLKE